VRTVRAGIAHWEGGPHSGTVVLRTVLGELRERRLHKSAAKSQAIRSAKHGGDAPAGGRETAAKGFGARAARGRFEGGATRRSEAAAGAPACRADTTARLDAAAAAAAAADADADAAAGADAADADAAYTDAYTDADADADAAVAGSSAELGSVNGISDDAGRIAGRYAP